MNKISIFVVMGLIFFLGQGCSDFLEKDSTNLSYVRSTEDLNELLVGDGYMALKKADIGEFIHVMDDDTDHRTASSYTSHTYIFEEYFFFKKELSVDATGSYVEPWVNFYKRIGVTNVILQEVDKFKNEPGNGYRKVKGEALFLRAAYYYFLLNLYCKPYSEATAKSDLGVPLKLTGQIEDKHYSRTPLATCYEQVVKDLTEAIQLLEGIQQPTIYRANSMGARSLLSRVLLYMGRWEEAVKQCDTIIASTAYALLDYNGLDRTQSHVIGENLPETIFSTGYDRVNYGGLFLVHASCHLQASTELVEEMYDVDDLRRGFFFRRYQPTAPGKHYEQSKDKSVGRVSDFCLFRLPEAYLNRAEALCALGEDEKARADIQALRVKRYVTGSLPDLTLSGEELMNFIRDERRRELCFEGHRWFDLRRYAVHPKWPFEKEIRHRYEDKDFNGYYICPKYSEAPALWLLPIPEEEIIFNEGALVQNDVRPEIELTIF